jgi:hypothetical protein
LLAPVAAPAPKAKVPVAVVGVAEGAPNALLVGIDTVGFVALNWKVDPLLAALAEVAPFASPNLNPVLDVGAAG